MRRIRDRVTVLGSSRGAYVSVVANKPASIHSLDFIIFNRLPFPIELDGLHLEIVLESTVLATCDKVCRLEVNGCDVGMLQVQHDLSDSQAELVRRYPEGQRPMDCASLRMSGQTHLRTSFSVVTLPFGVETRAFIYRGT